MNKFENLIPYRKASKWGFADKNRNLQVPCVYDFACPFEGPLAAVEINRLWGAVNLKGQLVIPCVYFDVLVFREGLASGTRDGKSFEYIAEDGTPLTNLVFEYCGPFNNGKAIVSYECRYGVINRELEGLIDLKYDALEPFGEHAYRFKLDGVWGLLDENGEILLQAEYDSISDLNEEKAVAEKTIKIIEQLEMLDDEGDFLDWEDIEVNVQRYGVIDKYGKIIVPCDKDFIRPYNEGVGVVCESYGYGEFTEYWLIDEKGNDILGFKTSAIREHSGYGTIVLKNDKWGVITKNDKWIIEAKYEILDKCTNDYYLGVFRSADDSALTWDYMDAEGAIITSIYNYVYVGEFRDGLALVSENKKYGYVNLKGELVIPPQFEIAKPFHDGLARVKMDKWGFIDTSGKFVVDCKYDVLGNFTNGYAEVRDWSDSAYKSYHKIDFHHPGFWNIAKLDEDSEEEEIPWQPLMGYLNKKGEEFFEGYFPHTSLSN